MHAQDLFAARNVRVGHCYLAVKAAGTHKRRIQHIRTVGGRDENNAFVRLKSIHLDEELIERLFALVVAAAEARATMAANSINFVNEDDAGGILLCLLEHVAHARCANAHEHLHEVRT